jgi:lipopolysaccharide/colanic/teichoic acid biosynthesis glycosyltransferase
VTRVSAPQRWQWAVKRVVEWIAAFALLLITAPLQALMAILIKLDSPGPAVFTQTRVGLNGRRFRMHKFRTLRWAPEAPRALNPDGSTRVEADDERLTRVGRWLRSGWDELPQLWNILKGDMALIGPRPDEPFHLQLYPEEEKRRLSVRPGITGLPQVSGRNGIPWAQRRLLDLFYIDHYSLWLDVRIAVKTCRAFLQRDEALTWRTNITRRV